MTVGNSADYKKRFKIVKYTKKWAVTMTKVCIRQAVARTPWPRWHLVTFSGKRGSESKGVVDLIAIRKNHRLPPLRELKRGDAFHIVLIQVKGGSAASPTAEDGKRLRAVARLHRAQAVLLSSWKKGKAARFFSLRPTAIQGKSDWIEVSDMKTVFC